MPCIADICAVVAGVETVEQKIVAALHDIVEDGGVTLAEVRDEYGDTTADAVDALTRREGEDYLLSFIPRVARNAIATTVKIADLNHNLQIQRIKNPTPDDFKRHEKYARARSHLIAAQFFWPSLNIGSGSRANHDEEGL